ncbi:hypothetical protein B0H14DRAFT_2576998 [Mycena olivaceomarginata]|nr:hypothetical protein B0H14DRAFT_2576998 [Mycena olivaceomarginata]
MSYAYSDCDMKGVLYCPNPPLLAPPPRLPTPPSLRMELKLWVLIWCGAQIAMGAAAAPTEHLKQCEDCKHAEHHDTKDCPDTHLEAEEWQQREGEEEGRCATEEELEEDVGRSQQGWQ